jgi:HEPN domain
MAYKGPYNIRTDEDFHIVMEEIDKDMRDNGIPVTARQLKGWLKFSSRFGLGLMMSDPLSQRVMDWFETRYGDLLKVDRTFGNLPVIIRNDIYRLRVPMFGGKIEFICDPRFWMPEPPTQIAVKPTDPLPRVNVLNCIDGLTESYALTLTLEEQKQIVLVLTGNIKHLMAIDKVSSLEPLIKQGKGDLKAAITHLFERPPLYGLSKWGSLQAVEKFLKAFMSSKGVTFPHNHNLQALANLAEANGFPTLSSTNIANVQCSAGVRYGGIVVLPTDAVEAYYSAINICGQIAANM